MIRMAWLVSVLSLFGLGCGDRRQISADAHRWVDDGATLLDVRTAGEFSSGHLPDAINIPVQQLPQRMVEVPPGRVVVYCQSGGRSASAARTLRGQGREVLDLGGIRNW